MLVSKNQNIYVTPLLIFLEETTFLFTSKILFDMILLLLFDFLIIYWLCTLEDENLVSFIHMPIVPYYIYILPVSLASQYSFITILNRSIFCPYIIMTIWKPFMAEPHNILRLFWQSYTTFFLKSFRLP